LPLCNRLTVAKFFKIQTEKTRLLNNLLCNRLPKICNRLPVRKFQKIILKSHILSWEFEKPPKAYKYVTCVRKSSIFCTSKTNCCCNQEEVGLLICKFFWTQGKGVPRWFRSFKGIYMDSGNLKWIAWERDVGTESGWTSINWVYNSLFPNLIYIIAL